MPSKDDYRGLNGRVQAHVEGFHKDYNRANILQALWRMGGRYLISVNDWELARDWVKMGGVACLRIKGEGILNDDDLDARGNPEGYADYVCNLLDKARAEVPAEWADRLWGHAGNELGSTDPARQDAYGERVINRFTARGYKIVFGSWSIQNPYDDPATPILEHFAKLPKIIAALRHNGGRMGFHEGTDSGAKTVLQAIAQGKIGRFIDFQEQYGIKVWITEFTGSATPHEGWRTLYGGDATYYARMVIRPAVENIYDPYDAWVSLFTLGEWSVGNNFGFMGETGLQEDIATINQSFTVEEEAPVPTNRVWHYAPAYVCPWIDTGKHRLFGRGDEHCQSLLRTDGVIDFMKNAQCEEFRIFGGHIQRGKDTSELYTPDGAQHGEYYIPYAKEPRNAAEAKAFYFSDWLPEWVYEGLQFKRTVWVGRKRWDGTLIPEKSGTHSTTITVVKHHDKVAFPSGITVFDVLQMHVDGVAEDYYYARNQALVAHYDQIGKIGSWVGSYAAVTIQQPARTINDPRPVSAPPPKEYPTMPPANQNTPPAPTSLGTAVPQIVGSTSALVSNVRNAPDADGADAGKVITTIKIGDQVKARPTPWSGNGHTWRVLTEVRGEPVPELWVAEVAVLVDPPAPPEPILRWVSHVPFISQLGSSANLRENDCGNAVVQAAAQRRLWRAGVPVPLLDSINRLISNSPLAGGDRPTGVEELIAFGALLGVKLTHTIFTEQKMLEQVDADRLCILLGNYGHINPAYKKIGHWFALTGYTANGWVINDSYLLGEGVRLSKLTMRQVQTDLKDWQGNAFAGAPYQGFLID